MKLNEIRADALKKLEAIHAKSERDFAALKTYLFGKAGVLTAYSYEVAQRSTARGKTTSGQRN